MAQTPGVKPYDLEFGVFPGTLIPLFWSRHSEISEWFLDECPYIIYNFHYYVSYLQVIILFYSCGEIDLTYLVSADFS